MGISTRCCLDRRRCDRHGGPDGGGARGSPSMTRSRICHSRATSSRRTGSIRSRRRSRNTSRCRSPTSTTAAPTTRRRRRSSTISSSGTPAKSSTSSATQWQPNHRLAAPRHHRADLAGAVSGEQERPREPHGLTLDNSGRDHPAERVSDRRRARRRHADGLRSAAELGAGRRRGHHRRPRRPSGVARSSDGHVAQSTGIHGSAVGHLGQRSPSAHGRANTPG